LNEKKISVNCRLEKLLFDKNEHLSIQNPNPERIKDVDCRSLIRTEIEAKSKSLNLLGQCGKLALLSIYKFKANFVENYFRLSI